MNPRTLARRATQISLLLLLVPSSAVAAPLGLGPSLSASLALMATDPFAGTWVLDPTCTGTNRSLPPSFSISFKSTDDATGLRTYHVASSALTEGPLGLVAQFDQDAVAESDSKLYVPKTLPWQEGALLLTSTFGLTLHRRPGADNAARLEADLQLFTPVGWFRTTDECAVYVRKPRQRIIKKAPPPQTDWQPE